MSREVITAVSRWARFVFGLLFIVSMYFGQPFVEKLLAWFFLWFFIFHFHYGSNEDLASRTVKQIDYYYLGIAAIGIILLGFSSSSQRETFTNQYFSIIERQHATSLVEGSRLFEEAACGTAVPVLATSCDVSSQIKRLLTGSYSASDLRDAAARLETALQEVTSTIKKDATRIGEVLATANPDRIKALYDSKEASGLYETLLLSARPGLLGLTLVGHLRTVADDIESKTAVAAQPFQQLSQYPELRYVMIGLGQTILWPFALAIAFALRITKVTADVGNWAA